MVCEICGREERQHIPGKKGKRAVKVGPGTESYMCGICTHYHTGSNANKKKRKKRRVIK